PARTSASASMARPTTPTRSSRPRAPRRDDRSRRLFGSMGAMLPLTPSSPAWLAAALAHLPAGPVDHPPGAEKAATMALPHVEAPADWPGLAPRVSRLAREELVHFERVLACLAHRGIPFRGLHSSGYGASLMAAVRPPPPTAACSWRDDHTVDEMLV